jgi:NADH:ubiquinone oxidoreductase subunit K
MSSDIMFQLTAAFLFMIGLLIMMVKKNSIMLLLGIELMLNAANLSLVSFSQSYGLLDGQLQVFFIITIAAAESAIGLSILVNLYRHIGSINSSQANKLKG